MAKKFLTPIAFPALNSDPAIGPEGSVYYNTRIGALKISDGTYWQTIQGGGGSGGSGVVSIQALDNPPPHPIVGSVYFDTQERTLKTYNGIIWYDVAGPKEMIDHIHFTEGPVKTAYYGQYVDLENYLVTVDGGTASTSYASAPNNDIIDGGNA